MANVLIQQKFWAIEDEIIGMCKENEIKECNKLEKQIITLDKTINEMKQLNKIKELLMNNTLDLNTDVEKIEEKSIIKKNKKGKIISIKTIKDERSEFNKLSKKVALMEAKINEMDYFIKV